MVILECKMFTLRYFREGDAESLQRSINNRNIANKVLTVPHPYTLKDAQGWVRLCLEQYKNPDSDQLNFVISINNEVAGGIGFSKMKENSAELGYWLAETYWGKGIMTEAVKKIVKYGFEELKLRRIEAKVFLFNKGSSRVLEKAGFTYEKILHGDCKKDGKILDVKLYSILP